MKKIIIILAVVLLVGVGGYYIFGFMGGEDSKVLIPAGYEPASGVSEEDIAMISSYDYSEQFTHSVYNFSFRHPSDFTVTQIPMGDDGEVITVQNTVTNIGVQILVTPFAGEDIDITADVIMSDISDMMIVDAQEVIIGTGRKGLAFLSDNKDFGGASREVWFVFRGNLYQISTYAELDEFLKGMFGTWQF